MPFGDANLRTFCSMGVPVTFNGVSAYPDGVPIKGNFDRASQNLLGEQGFGGISVDRPTVTLPYNAFNPMPDSDDILLVDGVEYSCDSPDAQDDGAFLSYALNLSARAPAALPSVQAPMIGSGATLVTMQAGTNLLPFQVVSASSSLAVLADNALLTDLRGAIGVVVSGAQTGQQVGIQIAGQMSNPAWNWVQGTPVYLASNGQLTQVEPTVGYLQIIGEPLSATSMLIEIDEPIQL